MTELTCIVCPRGCTLRIEERDGRFTVTGNACKRGEQFAMAEMTCPTRTLCTTCAPFSGGPGHQCTHLGRNTQG